MKAFLLATMFVVFSATPAVASTLTLEQALKAAEKFSPELQARREAETASRENTEVLKASLYPHLDAVAVDTFGFPGSTGEMQGYGGLLSSPFKVGAAAGVVARMDVFNLTAFERISSSHYETMATEQRTRTAKFQLDQSVLQSYFEASRSKGEKEIWKNIDTRVKELDHLVQRFVKNGQIPGLSLMLLRDQSREATLRAEVSQEHYDRAISRLSLLTGVEERAIDCPVVSELAERDLAFLKPAEKSPIVMQAEAEAESARINVTRYKAEYWPRLQAVASAGTMEGARLVPLDNWSAWLGVSVPLFDGFRISSEVHRAEAAALEREHWVVAAKLELDQLNVNFDEAIRVSQIELRLLKAEEEEAIHALEEAKHRFVSFLGNVADVREGLRNLARIETERNNAATKLLLSIGSKAVLNGAR